MVGDALDLALVVGGERNLLPGVDEAIVLMFVSSILGRGFVSLFSRNGEGKVTDNIEVNVFAIGVSLLQDFFLHIS